MKVLRPLILFFVLVILAGVLSWRVWSQRKNQEHDHVHLHAGFQVYINGQKQDYTDFRFMHVKPCGGNNDHENLSEFEKQQEKAHLHDSVGDVVHVHAPGATWGDLFKNLGVSFPGNTPVVGYGQETYENILSKEILANESIAIIVGDQSTASAVLDKRVTLQRIQEVEAMSESCGAQ